MARELRPFLRILGILGALALASACGDAASAPPISGDELMERIAAGEGPFVLDVRTPEEFAAGRVPRAVNIPHTELAARLGEIGVEDRAREVVVYCESGRRAAEAEATLRHAGFSAVRHLEGDMKAWRNAERPCEGC